MASVVEPGSVDEVATLLRDASRDGLAVIPRGGGTKLDWGRPPRRADLVLSTVRLDRVLEHAWGDMTATVEAGCTVARLQHALAEHGQRLACDPLWPERATIGGILAASDNGPLRARFGALRDLIIGVTLVLADGTVAKSGGKVVKNVAGYDLPKLATGSFGTLAVITQAVFRLHPRRPWIGVPWSRAWESGTSGWKAPRPTRWSRRCNGCGRRRNGGAARSWSYAARRT